MQELWKKGQANAREITEALNRDDRIAHSTVQTLLRKLEAKGAVGHYVEDRTFVFFPLVEEDRVKHSAATDLVQHVFGGSVGGLVTYLLENEKVPSRELEEIRRLIDERKAKEGG
jgi:BlaI family penicillinase repressor